MKVENPSYFQNLNPMLGAGKQKSRLHQVIKASNLPNEIRQKYPLTDQTYKEMVDMSDEKYLSSYRNVPPTYEKKEPKKTLIIGKSPCWPGSKCKFISHVNIKNREKRDIISKDDDGDQRLLKLNPKREQPQPKELYKYSNKPMCTRTDFALNGTANVFGVGPYKVGVPNKGKDLTTTAFFEKSAAATKCRKQAWTEKISDKQLKEETNREKQTNHSFSSRLDDTWIEEVQNSVTKSRDETGKVPRRPTDPSLWSVELMRKEDRVCGLINSSIPVEKQKQLLFEKVNARRLATASKIREYKQEKARFLNTSDSTSFMYTPPIKLSPTKVWDAIENNNDEKTNLFHSPYKTIAQKRYHLIHSESVPDLRDWIKKYKKEYVLGYHTSCFN